MRIGQLAIEEEGNVGVELLLQLEELKFGIIPRPRLMHREEHFVALRIVREKIDHIGPFHPGRLPFFHGSASILLAP